MTQEEVDRQFAIGRDIFNLPTEEKLKYRADLEHGNYNGYRPLGSFEIFPGLRDNFEMYNVFKFLPECERSQPEIVKQHKAEIEKFQRKIAEDIAQKILVLISIALELPEDYLSQGHQYNDVSDCHLRYMIYHARSEEENAKYVQNLVEPFLESISLVTPSHMPRSASDPFHKVETSANGSTFLCADIVTFTPMATRTLEV